jgi:actin-related protein
MTAVIDCQVTRHTAQTIPLGGKQVEDYLNKLLSQDSEFMQQWGSETPIDDDFVRSLKESDLVEVKIFKELISDELLKDVPRAEFRYKEKIVSTTGQPFQSYQNVSWNSSVISSTLLEPLRDSGHMKSCLTLHWMG